MNITIDFYIFELVQVSASIDSFDFLDQICPKRVFPVENGKSEHHHLILHIRIRLGAKFQPKLTILIFLEQICPKRVPISSPNRKSKRHH